MACLEPGTPDTLMLKSVAVMETLEKVTQDYKTFNTQHIFSVSK